MAENLLLPIYIDTNLLLDILASVEGGFTLVEKVTTRATTASDQNKTITAEAGTEFGIPNFLNLLKIKLGGSVTSHTTADNAEEIQAERYHTYGSLLHRLRNYLDDQGMIKRFSHDDSWNAIKAADFIEIHGLMRPNPVIDSLERVNRIVKLAALFTGEDTEAQHSSGSKRRKSKASKATQSPDDNKDDDAVDIRLVRKFIEGLLEDVYNTNIRRFVVDIVGIDNGTAVILVFTNYLRDSTLTEISHKEYRILGKVVRKVTSPLDRPINLLLGTALDGVGAPAIAKLQSALHASEDIQLPELQPTVSAPTLEIVPIAIYV